MDGLDPKTLELLKRIQDSKDALDSQKLQEVYGRATQPYTEDVNMIDKVSPSLQQQTKLMGNIDADQLEEQMRQEQLQRQMVQPSPRFSKLLGK